MVDLVCVKVELANLHAQPEIIESVQVGEDRGDRRQPLRVEVSLEGQPIDRRGGSKVGGHLLLEGKFRSLGAEDLVFADIKRAARIGGRPRRVDRGQQEILSGDVPDFSGRILWRLCQNSHQGTAT